MAMRWVTSVANSQCLIVYTSTPQGAEGLYKGSHMRVICALLLSLFVATSGARAEFRADHFVVIRSLLNILQTNPYKVSQEEYADIMCLSPSFEPAFQRKCQQDAASLKVVLDNAVRLVSSAENAAFVRKDEDEAARFLMMASKDIDMYHTLRDRWIRGLVPPQLFAPKHTDQPI
jgi:hypothetical protein